MEKEPLVSIITATYNRSNALQFTIESVINQEYKQWELIVVGDHCTDDTETVVKSFEDPRIRFHNLESNIGEQSGPNNYGLESARGELISFLNHDDLWFPDHLNVLIEGLRKHNADLVYSWYFSVPVKDEIRKLTCILFDGSYHQRLFIPASTWLFKRDLISEIGKWSYYRTIYEVPSQDWIRRVERAGKAIRMIPNLSVVAIQTGRRPEAYRKNEYLENQEYLKAIRDNPLFRQELLSRIVLAYASVDNGLAVLPLAFKIIKNLITRLISPFGISPRQLTYFTRFGKKGGFMNHLRKKRGVQGKS